MLYLDNILDVNLIPYLTITDIRDALQMKMQVIAIKNAMKKTIIIGQLGVVQLSVVASGVPTLGFAIQEQLKYS